MCQRNPSTILKSHDLRITNSRVLILSHFINTDHALSQGELEGIFSDFDRVTIYRTLQNFLDKGIIHRIPSESGFASYGLCFTTCTPEGHHHNHLHFRCSDCGHIQCLEKTSIPEIELPNEYEVDHVDLIIAGKCIDCQHA